MKTNYRKLGHKAGKPVYKNVYNYANYVYI